MQYWAQSPTMRRTIRKSWRLPPACWETMAVPEVLKVCAKFQQAGLGDVIASWIGSGQNQAISGEQLSQVLGHDTLSGLASQLGVNSGDVAGQLSNILPGLVDKLTPAGQSPAGGLGNADDLMGALGNLFNR